MGRGVSAGKHQTCVRGQVCKGRAALANHQRKRPVEQVRDAAFVFAAQSGVKPMGDATLVANFDAVARRLGGAS